MVVVPIMLAANMGGLVPLSAAFAAVAGLVAHECIPGFGLLLLHAGRRGRDLNKPTKPVLPESLGMAAGTVYLIAMFLFIPVPFVLERTMLFPFEQLGAYTAALLSITCMLFLGFADDVLNVKWRHKILLPAMSVLPLLMIYSVTSGRTEVVVPLPLRPILGHFLQLGVLYYVYMALLAIFCTHSINILAGVNGVEVGQSVVIALSIVLHNLMALRHGEPPTEHVFSLTLILPFVAVSLALLRHNWWPASVFVGDTFCYFAGMTFAVSGILGHFGKTLLLFFVPQIFNFVYSLPQLLGIVSCPRHRLPSLNPTTGALEPSKVTFTLDHRNAPLVSFLSRIGLLRIYAHHKDEITTNNLTLLNLLLVHGGSMREDRLALLLMSVQTICSLSAILLRHHFASYFFP
jgi:UDP-N-acetylglucosamine--dolichyl-phosphate N-acetylglucosaminephosphotransferase